MRALLKVAFLAAACVWLSNPIRAGSRHLVSDPYTYYWQYDDNETKFGYEDGRHYLLYARNALTRTSLYIGRQIGHLDETVGLKTVWGKVYVPSNSRDKLFSQEMPCHTASWPTDQWIGGSGNVKNRR